MEIVREEDLSFKKPKKDYPYGSSAKIFNTDQVFMYKERLEPGKRASAPHFHEKIEEAFLVTKGELIAVEGDVERVVQEGDFLLFKPNERKHYLENRSSEIAEFIIFRQSQRSKDVIF